MNLNLCVIIILFILTSCSLIDYMPEYEKIADRVTEHTANKLRKERNLHLIGTGGRMMDDIKMMAMSFNYYHEVDLPSARKLLMYALNEYLVAINRSEKIRPYLHDNPFTAKNIEIIIFLFKPDGNYLPRDKIQYISASDGKLTYYLDVPETYSIVSIYEETYEEAKQALISEQ